MKNLSDQWRLNNLVFLTNRFLLAALISVWLHGSLLAQEKGKIARPVDSDRSFETATFQADDEQVWHLLLRMLSDHGFEFVVKNKDLGRIETNYIIFSKHPQFSKLSNGVKSFAKTPRMFLRKWIDGRIRVFAEVHKLAEDGTKLVLRPDIYGFAATVTDDSGVSGEWRQCKSNGKFEFELFNEIATALRKEGSVKPLEVTEVTDEQKATLNAANDVAKRSSTLVLSSVPEGAEILLNNQLVGMTPSRLTVTHGPHKLVLRKKGYKDFVKEFVVLKDSDLTISAEMERP
jgi:hypothetical protein